MLRARLSCRLFGLIHRTLPNGLAERLTNFLRLKTPAPPEFLAAMLVMISANALKDFEKHLADLNAKNPDLRVTVAGPRTEEIAIEVLCALAWLALSILSHDEFAADPESFQEYTLLTFQALGHVLEQERAVALLRKVGEEPGSFI